MAIERRRVILEGLEPEVDGGRFAVKRTVGEEVVVRVDMFADGHDRLAGVLRFRHESEADWSEAPLEFLTNDRWEARFTVRELGRYLYTVEGWVDAFGSWAGGLRKKVEDGQEVSVDLRAGAEIVERAAERAGKADRETLLARARELRGAARPETVDLALSADLAELVGRHPDRSQAARYGKELVAVVDPPRARFSAWYEMFPRSCSPQPGRHGTLRDCEARLDYVESMGFDVVYLPPIHPIGRVNRKGKNNSLSAGPDDAGSPWAIGAEEGGHKSVHPELGTIEDFVRFVEAARARGIEVAIDIAFQCAPDHPYAREHPEWFRRRPDGRIQYAENPPKKYEDIYPFDFDSEQWLELWEELRAVVLFWIDKGVKVFRVDNPHTKPLAFWEWLIDEIKKRHPEVLFLSEAFTRPKVMYRLAKLGFSQSYTYFAWRNTKWELTQYFEELTRTRVREYFRPNLWPNTPDILTEYLQAGGRPAFMARFVLAATLGASYGIYGPPFELCENVPRQPGSEEYADSEKYEVRHWDLDRPGSLSALIGRVNRIRRDNPALHGDRSLRFHPTDNDHLIAYSKHTRDLSSVMLVVVNLDPHHTQSGWLELPLEAFRLDPTQPYQVHDLLGDARYLWHGPRNYVELNPQVVPAHLFCIRRRTRTERDFDYYL